MSRPLCLIITAEHGGNRVPRGYATLFRSAMRALETHRGWDPGSLPLARRIALELDAPLVHATTTRLLVDLNRSPGNPAVFSEFSRGLNGDARRALLARFHTPHWEMIRELVRGSLEAQEIVLHLGVHTFTAQLDGKVRRADIGLLYDPSRHREREVALRWKAFLNREHGGLRVRMNYPYAGRNDGVVTALRREFPAARYLGIELEVNQGLLPRPRGAFPLRVSNAIVRSLRRVVEGERAGS